MGEIMGEFDIESAGFEHQAVVIEDCSFQCNLPLALPLETENSVDTLDPEDIQKRLDASNRRNILERTFLVTNFIVELASAVFDQLSSVENPHYALISMLMSLTTMVACIIHLAEKGRRERVKLMRRGHALPWFYSPSPSYKPLGAFSDIVGLVGSIFQCFFAIITYIFLSQHAYNPVKLSIWPIIFSFIVLCSKFPRTTPRTTLAHNLFPLIPLSTQSRDLQRLQINPLAISLPQQIWNPSFLICDEMGIQAAIEFQQLERILSCFYIPAFCCPVRWLREVVRCNYGDLIISLKEERKNLAEASSLILEDYPAFLCVPEYLWTLENLEFLHARGCPLKKFSPEEIRKTARVKYLSH